MLLSFDDVLQLNLTVDILDMKSPTRNFIDVGSVNCLFDTRYSEQARFGEVACSIRLIIFEFSQGFQKRNFKLIIGKNLYRLMNYPILIQQCFDLSQREPLV